MKKLAFALALALGLGLVVIQFVAAHSFVDHCTPEVGSTVPQAPNELRCTFTDAIDPKQTVIAVFDANNNQVDNKDLKGDPNDPDGKTVVETLNTAKITGGLYTVKWSTVSADGHATDGQFQFAVSTPAAPIIAPTKAPTTTTAASPTAAPTSSASTASPTPTTPSAPAPSLNTISPSTVVIAAPSDGSSFPNAPADIVVNIQTTNFPLGQSGHRWQIYLDGKLMLQVMDGSTSAELYAVPAGDHWIKVALATGDNTVVTTAGSGIGVGPGPGDLPATAVALTCTPQSLSAGSDTWYQVPYTKGNQLEITLDANGANVGFDVWDPFQVQTWGTPDQTTPVGSGSPNAAEPAHDLTWAGHLVDNGAYYVHVTNNDSTTDSHRLCASQKPLP